MACPYFVPREILNDGSWLHPSRLPLGAGWTGGCCGSGREVPAEEAHVREFCNLGYASRCPHLPETRDWDAVRFCVARSSDEHITLHYACELAHAPVAHGTLTYELKTESWRDMPPDARINRLAASYLHVYRARRSGTLI